jgi:acyl-CoA thioesterase I
MGAPHETHESHEIEPMRTNPTTFLPRLVFGCLVCFVGHPLAAESSPIGKSETHNVVFFGDSLTEGYGLDDPASESYPAVIQKKIDDAHLPWRVVNAGLSGETSAGGLRRVDWILRQPIDVFVLALGSNDGLRGIEPAVTSANLQGIIDRVRAKNPATKIVLAGMMLPPDMGEDYTREFSALFSTLARKNGVAFVPFLLEGVGGRPELNQSDGKHPTPEGHAKVAETVWRILRPLL